MEKFNVYEFKGVYRHDGRKALAMKMSLEECINKYFFLPGNIWSPGRRNMKDFFGCDFAYDITELSILDIRDLVGKGYVFIPFAAAVDKEDVLNYIKAGLTPLFMRCKDYNAMQKAYKEIA